MFSDDASNFFYFPYEEWEIYADVPRTLPDYVILLHTIWRIHVEKHYNALSFAEDEDIVQVREGAVDAGQDAVHQALEGVPRVPHAEGHPRELEQTEGRGDRRLGDVRRVHGYLVVPLLQVDLGEDRAAGCPGDEIHHVWNGVCVRDGDGVEPRRDV